MEAWDGLTEGVDGLGEFGSDPSLAIQKERALGVVSGEDERD